MLKEEATEEEEEPQKKSFFHFKSPSLSINGFFDSAHICLLWTAHYDF